MLKNFCCCASKTNDKRFRPNAENTKSWLVRHVELSTHLRARAHDSRDPIRAKSKLLALVASDCFLAGVKTGGQVAISVECGWTVHVWQRCQKRAKNSTKNATTQQLHAHALPLPPTRYYLHCITLQHIVLVNAAKTAFQMCVLHVLGNAPFAHVSGRRGFLGLFL